MKFIIDDADIAKIKDIYNTFAVDGVTTNPSILAKSGRQPYEVLTEIREFIGPDAELHVQVIAPDAEGMVRDGHRIVEVLGKNTYVKVPTTKEGLRAMKLLHAEASGSRPRPFTPGCRHFSRPRRGRTTRRPT